MPVLPPPPPGDAALGWVEELLTGLWGDAPRPPGIRGGQAAADAALDSLDLHGYAGRRSNVLPTAARGATRLSPYIRHGLLSLPQVWAHAADAPARDRDTFRDELLWQEYARHLYARLGRRTGSALRFAPPSPPPWADPWPREMACMGFVRDELEQEGWLVNQTRMWVASQWSVRAGHDWQWTVGTGSGKAYGFSRWQVEKRAPALCASCPLRADCPIELWPEGDVGPPLAPAADLLSGTTNGGPSEAVVTGEPEAVWLTAESLGSTDPALSAWPDLPRVFVFDAPLLARLQLAGMRLVFLAQALSELDVEVLVGDPVEELRGRRLAVTFAPVPGYRARRDALDVVAEHPWPWLVRPGSQSLRSFSAWRPRR